MNSDSQYMRNALLNVANNKGQFLNSPEAVEAKKEAEKGLLVKIGNLNDFNKWIDKITYLQN